MKWQALSLLIFASTCLSTPITALPKKDIYTLRVSSQYDQDLDGRPLTVRPNKQIGVFPGSPAVQFYTVPLPHDHVELHTYPVDSDSEQVLAFIGKQGLLDFAVTDPAETPATPGTTCDWWSFGLGSKGRDNVVTYAGGKGGNWVAFKGKDGWTINWRSADAITIEKRSYMIVDVVYEPVGQGGPN